MGLLTVPNTFSPNTIIENNKLDANYKTITDALSGLIDIEILIASNGAVPTLTLNQIGTGKLVSFQLSGAEKLRVNNNGQLESLLTTGTAPFIVASTDKVINLNADKIDGLEAAAFVPIAGGTLTGFLTLHASPVDAMQAVNKQYVDTVVATVFPVGTKLLFGNNAPVGWTRVDLGEDALIKLAKSGETIGSLGGTWVISGLSGSGHSLTTAELPTHSHTISYSTIGLAAGGASAVDIIQATGLPNNVSTSNVGSGLPHTHNISQDGSWRPRYEIWVKATKD